MESASTQLLYKKKCCVPGCGNTSSSMYRFPKKEAEIFSVWLKNINNSKLSELSVQDIYNNYRVCERHFETNDIIRAGSRRRGVKRMAIPTLCLPIFESDHEYALRSSSALPLPSTSRISLVAVNSLPPASTLDHADKANSSSISQALPISQDLVDSLRPSTPVADKGLLGQLNVTRQKALSPKAKLLYKKVIESSIKMRRLSNRMKSFRERVFAAEKLARSQNFDKFKENVNPATYRFILSQIRTQCQKPKGRRFTLDDKVLALTILKASGKGYRLLSKIFSLPSRRTLTNLLNKIPFTAGPNRKVFKALGTSIEKMKKKDRAAILLFDEMFIDSYVHYSRKEDFIVGLQDQGMGRRKAELADHVNVVMVKGVYKQWKQLLCYSFSSGPTKAMALKTTIKELICECQNIGLNIVATVCDQGGPNQTAINMLLRESTEDCIKNNEEKLFFGFKVGGAEIVPLYDTPHLFKGLRNNLLTKDFYFKINGKECIAKWDHIEQFYLLDQQEEHRICPKLTDAHVLREKIHKMKVSCCTQVFSHTVGALMTRIVSWNSNLLDPGASSTGEAILFFDKLFDSLNSSQMTAPSSKPMKGAVTLSSEHIQLWSDSLAILNTAKFFNKQKGCYVSVPTLKNLIFTIKGFIYLVRKLLNQYQGYVILRVFQQDALENLFGCIRSYSHREVSPSALHFVTAFKALITDNYMSSHSPGANCEQDFTEGALNNLTCFLANELLPDVSSFESSIVEWTNPNIPVSLVSFKRTRIAKCTTAYISGFIAKKMLREISCQQCKHNILFRDNNYDLDFIEARQYPNSNLVKPGTFFNFVIMQSLSYLFYIIPRYCHYLNISALLQQTLLKLINFSPINCNEHIEMHLKLVKFIVTCSLFFWCKRVNKIAKGKDSKFSKFINSNPKAIYVDPIKVSAYRKALGKSKRKIKNKN